MQKIRKGFDRILQKIHGHGHRVLIRKGFMIASLLQAIKFCFPVINRLYYEAREHCKESQNSVLGSLLQAMKVRFMFYK